MTPKQEIPTYTKIGIRITMVLVLLLSFMLIKNCARSIIYGTSTSQEEIQYYYDLGFKAGAAANTGPTTRKPTIDNPLLTKTYRKGYRNGRDTARREKKSADGETALQ